MECNNTNINKQIIQNFTPSMSYLRQRQFLNDFAFALQEFISQIIQPQQTWTRYSSHLRYGEYEFALCYLTLTPNEPQDIAQYGVSVVSAEKASVVNLPRMNKQEASVLQYFGIERAITLHPIENTKIFSVLNPQSTAKMPHEQQLKQLKTLFMMAMKRTGLPDKIPILVFSQAPYGDSSQISVSGYCAGHHFAGVINGGGFRTSYGVGSLTPLCDLGKSRATVVQTLNEVNSQIAKVKSEQFCGIVCVPLISRYYEACCGELYQKNAIKPSVVVDEESQSTSEFQQLNLTQILNVIKTKKSKTKQVQLQHLDCDDHGNVYLNFITTLNKNSHTTHLLSRFIRLFPSLLYGPLKVICDQLKPTFPGAWEIYRHLPKVAKQKGTAVESIAFHCVADAPLGEREVMQIRKKAQLDFDQLTNPSSAEQSYIKAYFDQQFNDVQVLRRISAGSKSYHYPELGLPLSSTLRQICFSVHFGTAAIGSFDSDQADLNEAMVWTFHSVHDMDDTGNSQFGQAITEFAQLLKNQLGGRQIGRELATQLVGFVMADRTSFIYADLGGETYQNPTNVLKQFKNSENARQKQYYRQQYVKSNRYCHYGCVLCRLGEAVAGLQFQEGIYFVEFFIQQLKGLSTKKPELFDFGDKFDVLRHSLVYQKLIALGQCVRASQIYKKENTITPYFSSTHDQVQIIYNTYRENQCFTPFAESRLFQGIIYYMCIFAKENKILDADFVDKLILYIKQQKVGGIECIKFDQQIASTDSAFNVTKELTETLIYPYDNKFSIPFIHYVYYKTISELSKNNLYLEQVEQKMFKKIGENYEKSIDSYIKFLGTAVDSVYLYALAFGAKMQCSFLQNQIQKLKLLNFDLVQYFSASQNENIILVPDLPLIASPADETTILFNESLISSKSALNLQNMIKLTDQAKAFDSVFASQMLLKHFLKVTFEQAVLISTGVTMLDGEDRERVYKIFQPKLQPTAWELVLNSISPGQINNLPHRFYAQFLGFKFENGIFYPNFQNLIGVGLVETVPFRGFEV